MGFWRLQEPMFENPRRVRQTRNFTTNVPKILDLKSSSEQIFFRKLSLGAPDRWELHRLKWLKSRFSLTGKKACLFNGMMPRTTGSPSSL